MEFILLGTCVYGDGTFKFSMTGRFNYDSPKQQLKKLRKWVEI
jgi:hypothetical protein